MTSSQFRGRSRCAALGVVVGAGWLVLPVMTISAQDPVPVAAAGPVAGAAAPRQDETSGTDYVLPVAVVAAAGVLAGYGYLRRTRRARTRTTPGLVSARPATPTPAESERQARAALVLADDCVRTSREELSFVAERFGEADTEPYRHALGSAGTELSAAFAIWRRYEEGTPEDPAARRQALVGVVGRCAEAGRLLDAEADGLDRLRGLVEDVGAALEVCEGRFRELTVRTARARETEAELRGRFKPSGVAAVTGYVEQAQDRLVFATTHLNAARQSTDSGDFRRAARDLRAAEGAVAQAGVLVGGVERLAAELREAAALVPAALTGGEAAIAAARKGGAPASLAPGELHARLARADGVLGAVREELTGGPYDPLDALRRIARAVERLETGASGVVEAAALLVARSAVAGAEEFVTVHRGPVDAEARALLAEAARGVGAGRADEADVLARRARELAERDVRAHGNPYAGGGADSVGIGGAVLGGVLLAEDPCGGPPASFGGPGTRGRRGVTEPPGA
ncbi:hypothetical protein [Streptomyces sp. NPDC047028]|uniref:hypothetical protein n=1 Tax=Streptomyces sp. NPDC047028 TaxID=3155793 RepID=UPI0033E2C3AD